MPVRMLKRMEHDAVKQFSVFVENKVGRMADLIKMLETHHCHVMALTTLDTTDSSIARMVVDDPERVRELFQEQGIPVTESEVLVVEFSANTDLPMILAALLEAEVNINFMYSFLSRPKSKSALVVCVDDPECAVHALLQNRFKVLMQRDISR